MTKTLNPRKTRLVGAISNRPRALGERPYASCRCECRARKEAAL